MKLIIDKFQEENREYKVSLTSDLNKEVYSFVIIKCSKCLTDGFEIKLPRISMKQEKIEYQFISFAELINIDLLIPKIINTKFCLLNLQDEEMVKKYSVIKELFIQRLKYFDEPLEIIESERPWNLI